MGANATLPAGRGRPKYPPAVTTSTIFEFAGRAEWRPLPRAPDLLRHALFGEAWVSSLEFSPIAKVSGALAAVDTAAAEVNIAIGQSQGCEGHTFVLRR